MPNKMQEIYASLGYGRSPNYDGKAVQLFSHADGVDQAKFRVPRVLTKTHAFNTLVHPALHVQGAWCEGFAYNFVVADADMKKVSNNNLEVIARLVDDMYQK